MPNLSSTLSFSPFSDHTKSETLKIKQKRPRSVLKSTYRIRAKLRRTVCCSAGRILMYVLSLFWMISSPILHFWTTLDSVMRDHEPLYAYSLAYLPKTCYDRKDLNCLNLNLGLYVSH